MLDCSFGFVGLAKLQEFISCVMRFLSGESLVNSVSMASMHSSFEHLASQGQGLRVWKGEMKLDILVGGLVAIFYFPICWVANHPN